MQKIEAPVYSGRLVRTRAIFVCARGAEPEEAFRASFVFRALAMPWTSRFTKRSSQNSEHTVYEELLDCHPM